MQGIEYCLDVLSVLLKVPRIDENAVKITDCRIVEESLCRVIDLSLKSCGCVCEPERHDQVFIVAVRCAEGRFPFILSSPFFLGTSSTGYPAGEVNCRMCSRRRFSSRHLGALFSRSLV